ncbi:MAG: methyltransferase domain-containing protein [Verrucomicrobiota bacterium]
MKSGEKNPGKELYNQLRRLSCAQLWEEEVPRFNRATPQERIERVAVIRAVGVVFSETGTVEEKNEARLWLLGLLSDPGEKVRRYAMTALPKIGAGPEEEKALLSLLQTTSNDREKKFLGETLDKIGGVATLEILGKDSHRLHPQTEQKVKASVARSQSPGEVCMDRVLANFAGLRIHLRGRAGLEQFVRDEVEESVQSRGKFRVTEVRSGLVAMTPVAPFSLADLFSLRCFGTVGFVPGTVSVPNETESIEALAALITSPLSRRVLETFTEGTVRYRLNFVAKGHQRGAVRLLANRAYALCPQILNDARDALWAIDIHPAGRGNSVELRPRLSPDPRYYFRRQDVPAASHPPLAACMARLAGKLENGIVWDPFCGSGSELIERALLGGVRCVHGTDLSEEAIDITRENFSAAKVDRVQSKFSCCDFRDYPRIAGLDRDSVSLILTNPPMGKRVPIPNLRGLIEDLFAVAAKVLRPGGKLVFANPLFVQCNQPSLKMQSSRVVDFGGFDCRVEMYQKTG